MTKIYTSQKEKKSIYNEINIVVEILMKYSSIERKKYFRFKNT